MPRSTLCSSVTWLAGRSVRVSCRVAQVTESFWKERNRDVLGVIPAYPDAEVFTFVPVQVNVPFPDSSNS